MPQEDVRDFISLQFRFFLSFIKEEKIILEFLNREPTQCLILERIRGFSEVRCDAVWDAGTVTKPLVSC